MSEELKPCFFCGNSLTITDSLTWKGNFVKCIKCVSTYEISPEKYNSAYCWKEIERLEKQLKDASESYEANMKAYRIALEVKTKI